MDSDKLNTVKLFNKALVSFDELHKLSKRTAITFCFMVVSMALYNLDGESTSLFIHDLNKLINKLISGLKDKKLKFEDSIDLLTWIKSTIEENDE